MRPNSVGKAVEDRRDFDLGLQDTESPFDVGQRLVARDDLGRGRIGNVGNEDQFAIHQPRALQGTLVDLVGEPLGGVRGQSLQHTGRRETSRLAGHPQQRARSADLFRRRPRKKGRPRRTDAAGDYGPASGHVHSTDRPERQTPVDHPAPSSRCPLVPPALQPRALARRQNGQDRACGTSGS